MTDAQSDLLRFIRDLADHLAIGTELPWDEIRASLEMAKRNLTDLYAQYEQPAPEGAEVIREFMLEALQLFYSSIEAVESCLGQPDLELLARAVVSAEEANDILASIEYVIAQNQEWMSQFSYG